MNTLLLKMTYVFKRQDLKIFGLLIEQSEESVIAFSGGYKFQLILPYHRWSDYNENI